MRRFRTLRVSVTDRCDLDCVYCDAALEADRDAPGAPELSGRELSARQIVLLAQAAAAAGARTVRLTGGEPLLREDIEDIVSRIRAAQSGPRRCPHHAALPSP